MTLMTQSKQVVLVNGIPASGKSTLTRTLAARLALPVLTLDSIKEPFMAGFAPVDRQRNRQLGCAAYQAIWQIVAQAPQGCVYLIDAWFGFQPKSVLEQGLASAGVSRVLELWIAISPDDAAARYQARLSNRMPGHPGAEYLPELRRLAEQAKPMAAGPVYQVEASMPDTEGAEHWLRQQLQPPRTTHLISDKPLYQQG